MAALFTAAGILHLRNPDFFMPIMPPWVPFPHACIIVSGIFELLGSLGLLAPWPKVRRWAGWGLIALLIAVFPANIYMAIENVKIHGMPSQPWTSWARLPLQPILIAAVWWVARAGKAPASGR